MRAKIMPLIVGIASLIGLGPSLGQGMDGLGDTAFIAQTRLIGLSFDGMNAATVRQAAATGFDLSTGAPADVARWYAPRFPNLSAIFATEIGNGLSLIWGGSLGESGPKYQLRPSGVIGLSLRHSTGPRSALQVQIYGQYGGALRESRCLGDYGALGGVQEVNCRLAASALPPSQTLGYLWDIPPSLQAALKVSYVIRF